LNSQSKNGYYFAFIAAFLFSLAVPLSKGLLDSFHPMNLAGFTYLFSGLILLPTFWLKSKSEKIHLKDFKIISPMILFGSILAPISLLFGLAQISAFQASLFMNFELIFTALIAFFAFQDKIGKKGRIGLVIIILILLSWSINFQVDKLLSLEFSLGTLLVIFACFCWGMDNNIAQLLGEKSNFQITCIKGIIGGCFTLFLSYVIGNQINFISLTNFGIISILLTMSLLSYGLSIVFFLKSLKNIGTTKAGIIFSLSPFIAGILALIIEPETVSGILFLVYLGVLFGVFMILVDKHEHSHLHKTLIHIHKIDEKDGHHQPHQILIIKEKNGIIIQHEHLNKEHMHEHSHDLHHHHKH
jgi:drug/metabolite transporter (DMT)-like permease